MKSLPRCLPPLYAAFFASSLLLQGDVVINEIFYSSPNDLDELEYVEIYNSGDEEVELAGWKLSKGIEFDFPKDSVIAPSGFAVVCKDKKLFGQFYAGVAVVGEFKKSLGNGSDTVNLKNAAGKKVDSVEYEDEGKWPVSADGYSASLERICPTAEGGSPHNWAPSVLSDDYAQKPSGTPGKVNSAYQASLPPVIKKLSASVEDVCEAGTPIDVWVTVEGAEQLVLLSRVVEPGSEGEELSLKMERESSGRFKGSLATEQSNRIIRYRVQATGPDGAVRYFPPENEIRPALSVYVLEPVQNGSIPVAQFFNVGAEEFKRGTEYRENAGSPRRGSRGFGPREERPGGGAPVDLANERARREAEGLLRDVSLESVWGTLTLQGTMKAEQGSELALAFRRANEAITKVRDDLRVSKNAKTFADGMQDQLAKIGGLLRKECGGLSTTTRSAGSG